MRPCGINFKAKLTKKKISDIAHIATFINFEGDRAASVCAAGRRLRVCVARFGVGKYLIHRSLVFVAVFDEVDFLVVVRNEMRKTHSERESDRSKTKHRVPNVWIGQIVSANLHAVL